MHCDEKRTIAVLKEEMYEALIEQQAIIKQIDKESNNTKKIELQKQINNIEIFINDTKKQLSEME